MNNQPINLFRGYKVILFFILLESLTVPFVALFNTIAIQNIVFMAIMGFVVALFAVFILLNSANKWLIRYLQLNYDATITSVHHLWYLGVIGGVLEMIMFIVQNELFARGYGDFSTGFWSALISVAIALLIYKLILQFCNFAVMVMSGETSYVLDIQFIDIARLSLLMAVYEFVVCPITGWWIPYSGAMRIVVAIFSAVIGASCGGILVVGITKFIKCLEPKLYFNIRHQMVSPRH